MNREQYLEYVDHFNNKRYDAVTSYFTPDITVEYSSVWGDRTLHGPREFIDSYKTLHESVREVLEFGDQADVRGNAIPVFSILGHARQMRTQTYPRREQYAGSTQCEIIDRHISLKVTELD